jgi:hypothetical protein
MPVDGDIPVVPDEVVAWRAWRIVREGRNLRLRSLYRSDVWPPDGWLVATNDHGICAAFDRDHLEDMHRWGSTNSKRYVEDGSAIGKVGLSGRIVEGERGYRAERARVISIIVPYAAWELVEELRRAYGVPVGLGNILQKGAMSWTSDGS